MSGNLTGSARKVKDGAADLHNTIQKWSKYNSESLDIVNEIANIKLNTIFEQEKEENDGKSLPIPEELEPLCTQLSEYLEKFDRLVSKIEALALMFHGIKNLEDHNNKEKETDVILFKTWPVGMFEQRTRALLDMYKNEAEAKRVIAENICHVKDRNTMMCYTASWVHQPYINEATHSLYLEGLAKSRPCSAGWIELLMSQAEIQRGQVVGILPSLTTSWSPVVTVSSSSILLNALVQGCKLIKCYAECPSSDTWIISMSNGFDNPAFDDGETKKPPSDSVSPGDVTRNKDGDKKAGDDLDYRYGWGPFKIRCLQCCNKMSLFVVAVFIMCFVEGVAVNGIANAALPAIEKQFSLSSTKSALIPSSQDIGALCVVLFVSYIGGRYHKPRWVAAGSLIMALGSFIFIIPHLAEKYVYEENSAAITTDGMCNGTRGGGAAPPPCSNNDKYLPVFIIAQMVHGFGFTPMFTLGTVYIDENESHSLAAVYIGLTYAAAAIGVAAGFFVGGQIAQKLFVDFDRVSVDFDARDSRWIGAWWFGFVFTAVLFVLIAIPIAGFPKFLPGTEKYRSNKQAADNKEKQSCGSMAKALMKAFFKTFLVLLKNPVYMFLNAAGCAQTLIIAGVGAFSFKFLSEQYNLDFDIAGYLIGGLILTGSFGMFLGGLLVKIFKLQLVGMLRLCTLATLISALLGVSFLAGCPEVPLAGLEVTYADKSEKSGFADSCHATCSCDTQAFSMVCGNDDTVYYSPCHAGCSSSQGAGPMTTYGNCSCIASRLNVPITHSSASAKSGRCEYECSKLEILAPCLFFAMVSVLTAVTPSSMSTLRCVEEQDKPFALGIQWMFYRLLGTIPGPVLVGWVIDRSCLLWAGGSCGSSGFCQLYSHSQMSIGIMTWWVVVSLVASLLFFISSCFATRSDNKYEISKE
ncbi:hypothetical protein FSP39_003277 [Pinctada imbricata]|uniref:Solute carrier organic anion transporter family member n=1 Tax=Pinctada imbricata TaxID=66713 RepID=A0AA88XV68_PINIB|nr:hypothetical protein FSP39_003277 [Pinctada imbricata]